MVRSTSLPDRRIQRLVADEGGRFSTEFGLDLDARPADADRWFLAATLFGAPIRASTAMRTWRVLAAAGVLTVVDAGLRAWDELVQLLDEGGYGRYDYRTATRLHELAERVAENHAGSITTLASETDPARVMTELQALPGWGPTTTAVFLRELRGVWPGAGVLLDRRAVEAARALRIPLGRRPDRYWDELVALATGAGLDPRDVEAALIRRALRTRRRR